jgi:hypothetical protein
MRTDYLTTRMNFLKQLKYLIILMTLLFMGCTTLPELELTPTNETNTTTSNVDSQLIEQSSSNVDNSTVDNQVTTQSTDIQDTVAVSTSEDETVPNGVDFEPSDEIVSEPTNTTTEALGSDNMDETPVQNEPLAEEETYEQLSTSRSTSEIKVPETNATDEQPDLEVVTVEPSDEIVSEPTNTTTEALGSDNTDDIEISNESTAEMNEPETESTELDETDRSRENVESSDGNRTLTLVNENQINKEIIENGIESDTASTQNNRIGLIIFLAIILLLILSGTTILIFKPDIRKSLFTQLLNFNQKLKGLSNTDSRFVPQQDTSMQGTNSSTKESVLHNYTAEYLGSLFSEYQQYMGNDSLHYLGDISDFIGTIFSLTEKEKLFFEMSLENPELSEKNRPLKGLNIEDYEYKLIISLVFLIIAIKGSIGEREWEFIQRSSNEKSDSYHDLLDLKEHYNIKITEGSELVHRDLRNNIPVLSQLISVINGSKTLGQLDDLVFNPEILNKVLSIIQTLQVSK